MHPETPRIKLLFVGGQGRSGSTLLDRLLGQIPGVLSTGEIRHIWDRSLPDDQYCGCGLRFRQCEFWMNILSQALPGLGDEDVARYAALNRRLDRIRNIPAIVNPRLRRRAFGRDLEQYQEILAAVFRRLYSSGKCRLIVDSSKYPSHGYILSLLADVDLYVLHLVRDARAVAYSWMRRKTQPNTVASRRQIPRYSPVRTAMAWNVSNAMIHALGRRVRRYQLIRYEDLVRQPESVLQQIFAMVEEPVPTLDFLRDGHAELAVQHTIAGNPMRFERGSVNIRADLEWQTEMQSSRKLIVTGLTWPWLLRYGYGLGGRLS